MIRVQCGIHGFDPFPEDPPEKGKAAHSSILTWRIPMRRGAWRATVHGVTKSRTRLSDFHLRWYPASWGALRGLYIFRKPPRKLPLSFSQKGPTNPPGAGPTPCPCKSLLPLLLPKLLPQGEPLGPSVQSACRGLATPGPKVAPSLPAVSGPRRAEAPSPRAPRRQRLGSSGRALPSARC